jgi:hypothetical protein
MILLIYINNIMGGCVMTLFDDLNQQRELLIQKIKNIQFMRRGTININYQKVPQKGKEPILRGPYYVLSWNEGGKTVGVRLKPEELEQARSDVAAYKEFQTLTKEYVVVTEAITELVRNNETLDPKKN